MQPDALADLVVLTVKSAQAPLLERLAAAEARADAVATFEKTLAEIRDRLVAVETKAAMPQPTPEEPVDVTPLLERLATAEAQMGLLKATDQALTEVRDRLMAIETKAAMPPPLDVDVRDRVMALEHKAAPTFELPADLVTRLSAVEARPVPPVEKTIDLAPVFERLVKLEARLDAKVTETLPLMASLADLSKDVIAVREKVAAVAERSGVPGPPGKDGANGADGKAGADGMGWDDLSVEHDGERGFAVKVIRGERSKDAGTFTIPAMIYRGVYTEGRTYEPGDVVTYGGSTWHCHKSTVLKPDTTAVEAKGPNGRDFWTMAVKQGREGKPGRDGRDAVPLPVVTVGGR